MTSYLPIPDVFAKPYDGAIPRPEQFRRTPAHELKCGDWVKFEGVPYRVMSASSLQRRYVVLHCAPVEGGRFQDYTVMKYQGVEAYQS